ncbi:MAG: hypothetical protein JOZ73_02105 [Solirubrobacterales bacterium]|nr:hypothetical protein [Solirubrobacterales bacterium]
MRAVARLIVSVGVLLAAGTAQAATPPCGPSDASTIAADRVARVYTQGAAVYGCSAHGSQAYQLGSSQPTREARVGPVALAGSVAAYELSNFGVDTVSATVVVRRLSDGKQLAQRSAYEGTLGAEFFVSVGSVVVKRDGSAAWIVQGGSIISAERSTEVVALSHGDEKVLAATAAGLIDPKSLRLHGSKLTWTWGGKTRSATLR